jgi:hypothetical protein
MLAKPNDKIGSCGCGRSPTGDCCGWHGLTEDQFRVKLAEWENKNLQVQQKYNESGTLSE